jgi:hypothetical protein
MNIDYEMVLNQVNVIRDQDGLENIVKRVEWVVKFFDADNPVTKSTAAVETYLPTESLSSESFVAFEDLTHTQIMQWAFDLEGGNAFLDALLEGGHADNLAKLLSDAALLQKDLDIIPEA